MPKSTLRIYLFVFIMVAVLLAVTAYHYATYRIPRLLDIENIKENIEEYTVYYNGEEVDKEHVNIDDYTISYDLDKKEVYLAP